MEDREMILKRFGANLRRIRKAKGLKLLDIEVKTGIDTSEISKYERGKQSIELITIYRFAYALEVTPDQLFLVEN